MKKLFSILTILILSFVMVGCFKDPEPEPKPNDGEVDLVLDSSWNEALVGKNLYITTCGQADIDIVENLLRVAGVSETAYNRSDLLAAGSVEDDSVVLLVVGSSGKGLGAAGTDVSKENSRAQALVNKANEGKIQIILFHIGGVARRGDLSDAIINTAASGSSLMLVVKTGNEGGLFTNLVTDSRPLYLFSATAKILPAIKVLFGLE